MRTQIIHKNILIAIDNLPLDLFSKSKFPLIHKTNTKPSTKHLNSMIDNLL